MHLTNAQKEARENAESALRREETELHLPRTVEADSLALEIWERITKDLAEVELLDNLDSDMLGLYCLGMARLERLQIRYHEDVLKGFSRGPGLKEIESHYKILITYAEKLGLAPTARARLAVKKAKQEEDPDDDLFGGM